MPISKRFKKIIGTLQVNAKKSYALVDALTLIKTLSAVNFDESVDVAINLGVDPKKSDQAIRSSTVLPHGTGRSVCVAVFAQGQNAELAKQAGADLVGFEDLVEKIKAGDIGFDVLIATPDAMRLVSPLGAILGPKGLMPNPKVGTVAVDVAKAVKNAKGGQVVYRADKNGIVHCSIGKISFTEVALQKNLEALLADLKKIRPASAKGVFFKKITLSSTMGPGLFIDISSVSV